MYRLLTLSFLTLFISSCAVKSIPEAERVPVQIYGSTIDFNNDNLSEPYYTKVKDIGGDYIEISDIFSEKTHERVARANGTFAILYDNDFYVFLGYSKQYTGNFFAKVDKVGKIWAVYIDDYTSSTIKQSGNNYGGTFGLTGVLMKESKKWGHNWKNSQGQKSKFLLYNTTILGGKKTRPRNFAYGYLLSKRNFNDLMGTDYSKSEIDSFSTEDVIDIIDEINRDAGY